MNEESLEVDEGNMNGMWSDRKIAIIGFEEEMMQLTPGYTKKNYDNANYYLVSGGSRTSLPEEETAGTSSAKSLHDLGMRHLQR